MLTAQTLRIGGRYNWKNQPERLIYTGMCEPRNGRWHQFEKVDEPGRVWCEVLGSDLHMLEETPAADGVIVVGEAQQPGETYLAYLARCEREGRNTKPQAKDPDLCREPGCSNPTKTPVSAWCREHDRAGGAPHA
jgi:hypothetical protein